MPHALLPASDAEPPVHMVHEALPGGNAAACGLRPGDEIVTVDGAQTVGMSHTQLLRSLSGKLSVTLQVLPHTRHGTVSQAAPPLHTVTLRRPDSTSIHYGFLLGETDESRPRPPH